MMRMNAVYRIAAECNLYSLVYINSTHLRTKMSGPNVASATGTRLDSAAKHQIAVRASYEHLLSWVGYEQVLLQKEKHAFSIAKDDITIGVSKPVRKNESSRCSARNKAYPSVVTTLARMEQSAKNYLVALFHNPTTFQERDRFIQKVERRPDAWDPCMSEIAKKQIAEMPEFYFVGVSVGFAYPHPLSGDNVCTTMLGGMRTIINGAFPVDTGDIIQWYWEAETNCFDQDGRRHDPIAGERSEDITAFLQGHSKDLALDSARRKAFYERGNGVYTNSQTDGTVRYNGKREVAFPKALKPRRNGQKAIGDGMRAFGRAVSGARPFEPFDILIGRQSM